MNRANAGAAAGAAALVLALCVTDTPAARAVRWLHLARLAETSAWHLWRLGILAHGRYAEIMMDQAQKGHTTSGTDTPA